jgi:hypothetical protein
MSWTTPRTWVSGETVTASVMNTHVRDQFDYVKSSPSLSTLVLTGGAGAASLTLPATGRFYPDGGGDTYLVESSANTLSLVVGGTSVLGATAADLTLLQDVKLTATKKFYFDGGTNTYAVESSADVLSLVAGGNANLTVTATGITITGQPVSFGANDSAGSGYRLVKVPNV